MSIHVLHIEDRRENRLLVRKVLSSKGYRVTDAVDGLTGVELARSTRPDLILIDINLPQLNGYEVVTRLRNEPHLATIPIVAITAEGDREHALALGFDGFIPKPIRFNSFITDVARYLAGHRETIPETERSAHLLAHSRDVTDHLEARVRDLERANERLRDVDRMKMEVLRNVSHELSTPMTPLLGYVRMLEAGELGPTDARQRTVLQRMNGSLMRLKGLIDNLLNVTRYATDAVALERTVFDTTNIVDDAMAMVEEGSGARGIEFVVDVQGCDQPLLADRGTLVSALAQLLDNAVKFGPEGTEVKIEGRPISDADGDRLGVELAVVDRGPGIPVGERGRVCQPFYQIDGSATRAHGGAGLGLAIAERMVSLHGGRLVIGDAPGGGARVALRIPLRPDG